MAFTPDVISTSLLFDFKQAFWLHAAAHMDTLDGLEDLDWLGTCWEGSPSWIQAWLCRLREES